MQSYFDVQEVLNVANAVSNDTRKVAWGLLFITTPLGYAIANARYSTNPNSPHPFRVVLAAVGILLLLGFYQPVARFIDNTGRSLASQISEGGSFEALLDAYTSDVDKKVSTEKNQSSDDASWFDKGANLVAGWTQGILSSVLTLLGMFAVIVALHFYQIVQAVLFGVLVAVGPIVLAAAVLPGAWGMVSKWLSALFELAMWPVIGAVLFEMLGKALLRVYTQTSDDYIALFCANMVMVLCLALVPTIASRLVGSGFSGVSQMMNSKATEAATFAGNNSVNAVTSLASVAAPPAAAAMKLAGGALAGAAMLQPGAMSLPMDDPALRNMIHEHAQRPKL